MEEELSQKKSFIPWGLDADKLEPSSLQNISEDQIKNLSIGVQKKTLFQKHKEQEEFKKKQLEDETARVYAEFVSSFQSENSNNQLNKTFIRGETIINSQVIDIPSSENKEYKPQIIHSTKKEFFQKKERKFTKEEEEQIMKNKNEKKKRNIEELKEELKKGQEARETKIKKKNSSITNEAIEKSDNFLDESLDPESTNLYVANLSPQVNEQILKNEFGKFGIISNVKILWPKTEEEKKRNKNYGFVTFLERSSAEKAKEKMQGVSLCGSELKIGWGKQSIKLSSSLSSNNLSLPKTTNQSSSISSNQINQLNQITIKIPSDSSLASLIDRMADFVVQEGLKFEKAIMEKESKNEKYNFLFQDNSPEYYYYRWKIYSLLQGDNHQQWKTNPFQMYLNGPIWIPPPIPKNFEKFIAKQLPSDLRTKFEDMLKDLSTEKKKIKEAMIFALDFAEYSTDIVQILTESIIFSEISIPTKIARLFLISDILYNSSSRVPHASSYRKNFEIKLPIIFENLNNTYKNITGRITAENLKEQILRLLRIWTSWSVYTKEFTNFLKITFIGNKVQSPVMSTTSPINNQEEEDIDGIPIDINIIEALSKKKLSGEEEDIDGTPIS